MKGRTIKMSESEKTAMPEVREVQEVEESEAFSGNERQVMLPKFTGFAVRKGQIEAILMAKDLCGVLKVRNPEQSKDQTARSLLLMALDNKHVKLILNCKTSREIWERLCSIYERKSAATKLLLLKEFYDLQLGVSEKIHHYIARAEYVASQLEDIQVKIEPATLVSKIVSGLSNEYISFITSSMATKDEDQTIDNLLPRLMAEEE